MINATGKPTSLGDQKITSLQSGGPPGLPFLATPPYAINKGAEFIAAAKALFARFSTQPIYTRAAQINNFIAALIWLGIWQKLDALYLLAAADAQAAQRNWIADQFNLTPVNAPTFTADRGYAGNGTSSYLDTGFNPASGSPKYLRDSASFGIWRNVLATSGLKVDAGAIFNSAPYPGVVFQTNIGVGNELASLNANGSITSGLAYGLGHRTVSRQGSAGYAYYSNGAKVIDLTHASVAVQSLNIFLLALNQGGTPSQHSNARLSAFYIGSGLTDADVAALHIAMNTYLTAIGGN